MCLFETLSCFALHFYVFLNMHEFSDFNYYVWMHSNVRLKLFVFISMLSNNENKNEKEITYNDIRPYSLK